MEYVGQMIREKGEDKMGTNPTKVAKLPKWKFMIMNAAKGLNDPVTAMDMISGNASMPQPADPSKITDKERKDMREWRMTDLQLQEVIGKRIDESLMGIVAEKSTAYAQYKAILETVRRVAHGTIDDIDLKMKSLQQHENGSYMALEDYLRKKMDLINEWEGLSEQSMKENEKVKWIAKGLDPQIWTSFKVQYTDAQENATAKVGLEEFLSKTRHYNATRLDGKPDM
jgi:hypothetical protein